MVTEPINEKNYSVFIIGPQLGTLSAILVFVFLVSKTRTKQYYGLYGGQKIKGAFNLSSQEAEKGRQTYLYRFKAIPVHPVHLGVLDLPRIERHWRREGGEWGRGVDRQTN